MMSRYDDDYDVMGGAENENDAILLPLRKPRLPRAEEMIIKYNMLKDASNKRRFMLNRL